MKIWEARETNKQRFVRFGKHPTDPGVFAWIVDYDGCPIEHGNLLGEEDGELTRYACVDEELAKSAGIVLDENGRWEIYL